MGIRDIKIQLATEQMSASDYIYYIGYIGVFLAFFYYHTQIAAFVWLVISFREIIQRRGIENKSIGKPLRQRMRENNGG